MLSGNFLHVLVGPELGSALTGQLGDGIHQTFGLTISASLQLSRQELLCGTQNTPKRQLQAEGRKSSMTRYQISLYPKDITRTDSKTARLVWLDPKSPSFRHQAEVTTSGASGEERLSVLSRALLYGSASPLPPPLWCKACSGAAAVTSSQS